MIIFVRTYFDKLNGFIWENNFVERCETYLTIKNLLGNIRVDINSIFYDYVRTICFRHLDNLYKNLYIFVFDFNPFLHLLRNETRVLYKNKDLIYIMDVLNQLELALKIYKDNSHKSEEDILEIFKSNNITLHRDVTNKHDLKTNIYSTN